MSTIQHHTDFIRDFNDAMDSRPITPTTASNSTMNPPDQPVEYAFNQPMLASKPDFTLETELAKLRAEVERLKKDNEDFCSWIACKMLKPEWDSFKKSAEVIDHWNARAEKAEAELATLHMLFASEKAAKIERGDMYIETLARAEIAEKRLKWLEGFLQAGGTSINTMSYYTVENHPDDTDETHFNFPFQIGISVETENRGCYEWVEFSNGAKGLCPAIDAAKIKYAEWQNKMHKGDNQ